MSWPFLSAGVFVIIPVEVTDMETTLVVEPTTEEEAELKKAIESILRQIEESNARIRAYHADTDRLKAETQAMLARLASDLSR